MKTTLRKFSFRRTLSTLRLAVPLAAVMTTSAHAWACGDPSTRLDKLFNPTNYTYSISIIAHRGLWGTAQSPKNLVPENSMLAIYWASEKCLDGIELDVKMSRDDVPVIMHDYNAGRTTNAYMLVKGTKYSPERNRGFNPLISDMYWNQLKQLSLLLPNRSKTSAEGVVRIDDALGAWSQGHNQIPWIFDVKTASAVRAIDKLARHHYGDNAYNYFAMKVNVSLYRSRGAYEADAKTVRGIPVFVTNNLSTMNVGKVFDAWAYVPGHAAEINFKEYNGNLRDIFYKAKREQYGVGVFNALPDYDKNDNNNGRFYNSDGSCCYRLSDKLSNGDRSDLRGHFDFIRWAGFSFITTDEPLWLGEYLGRP